jgi:hypothetical protein
MVLLNETYYVLTVLFTRFADDSLLVNVSFSTFTYVLHQKNQKNKSVNRLESNIPILNFL